jgi:hypothetical protein
MNIPGSRQVPSVAAVMLTLLALRFSLVTTGVGRTLRGIHALTTLGRQWPATEKRLVRSIGERIAVVAAFFPGRALCLEQSLALYLHLRRRGIPAELCFGVRASPFAAHAWVEYEGEPVCEQRDVIVQFARLPEVAT